MGLEPFDQEENIHSAIVLQRELPIIDDLYGMALAPSSIQLSRAEMELAAALMREQRLKNALEPVRADFDFILIDCPPSLGVLSVMSLVAATHVLIPIQTEFKALKGTELLLSTIVEIIEVANKSLKIAGIVPTMFDSRTIQGQQSLESIKQMAAQVGPVLSIVPRKTDFANASQERVPLQLYSPQNPAIEPLKEIADRLGEL
jgi:chromosome partitioning protein